MHTPFVPAQAGTQRAQVALARAQPLSSPRRRGPITTNFSVIAGPATSTRCGVVGPAFAGTTEESHCFTSSQAGTQGHILQILILFSWVPAFAGTNGREPGVATSRLVARLAEMLAAIHADRLAGHGGGALHEKQCRDRDVLRPDATLERILGLRL